MKGLSSQRKKSQVKDQARNQDQDQMMMRVLDQVTKTMMMSLVLAQGLILDLAPGRDPSPGLYQSPSLSRK